MGGKARLSLEMPELTGRPSGLQVSADTPCFPVNQLHLTPVSTLNYNGQSTERDTMPSNHTPDLTKQAPRSPRVRLGGYVTLPRMLDKGRAEIAGKHGEYNYNCPMDQRFLTFAGIDAELLKKELAAGKGDGEILEWIQKNAKHQRADSEIVAWSSQAELRVPSDVESREYFHDLHRKAAPKREDISSWFDLLDVDDYISFGGKA
jgi:hypothetical protein